MGFRISRDGLGCYRSTAMAAPGQGRGICAYDMNADGVVTASDLPLLVAQLLNH